MPDLVYKPACGLPDVSLDGESLFTNGAANLRSRKWSYTLGTHTASGFERVAREETATLSAHTKAALDAAEVAFDNDIVAGTPGTLVAAGEWEQSAYVVQNEPDEIWAGYVTGTATVILLDGVWRRSTTYSLLPNSGEEVETGEWLDLPTDLECDLSGVVRVRTIDTSGTAYGCKVKLTFFGPCENPYAVIGGNTYGVNAEAASGERIVIDPTKRTTVGKAIYKVGTRGDVENLYSARYPGEKGSGSYVFEELPAGELSISWPQEYGVDVTLIEERSEPAWI